MQFCNILQNSPASFCLIRSLLTKKRSIRIVSLYGLIVLISCLPYIRRGLKFKQIPKAEGGSAVDLVIQGFFRVSQPAHSLPAVAGNKESFKCSLCPAGGSCSNGFLQRGLTHTEFHIMGPPFYCFWKNHVSLVRPLRY